jgi:hypothetical protein
VNITERDSVHGQEFYLSAAGAQEQAPIMFLSQPALLAQLLVSLHDIFKLIKYLFFGLRAQTRKLPAIKRCLQFSV